VSVETSSPFLEFLQRYDQDPTLFVRECFGVEPDAWQAELMDAVARGERGVSVRSGHGVGKSCCLSWLIIWHILTKYPQKTVCTAPTSGQLFDALASEVKAWINKLQPMLRDRLHVTTERIVLVGDPDASFVSFATSRAETPEALAGKHSDNVLLVADEASGIPEQVFEAASGSMSGHNAVTVLAGNPVRSSGLFYNSHHKDRADWYTIKVSCADNPRVAPDFIKKMASRYGERSNAFRVRVLGEFPLADDDTVIPFDLMESALKREIEPNLVKSIWGLDCARFGQDSSALARRKGNTLEQKVQSWHGLDTMQLVGHVKAEWDMCFIPDRPTDICVDAIGLGAGVADRLRELGLPARAVNVSESPALRGNFQNLRAELAWKCRDWFATRAVNLCNDDETGAQLLGPKYKITSTGKTQVESKSDMKKRGVDSPDRGDAFILTFAADAVSAVHGSSQNVGWAVPLPSRNVGL
jgi:phage terminase large subunit